MVHAAQAVHNAYMGKDKADVLTVLVRIAKNVMTVKNAMTVKNNSIAEN